MLSYIFFFYCVASFVGVWPAVTAVPHTEVRFFGSTTRTKELENRTTVCTSARYFGSIHAICLFAYIFQHEIAELINSECVSQQMVCSYL